jgi:transcriptional regulator with XRE-family HTH domain
MPQSCVMNVFSTNIRQCLKAYGWTARDLCDATGIQEANMSRILNGKEGVSIERADKIAKALEVPLSDLLSESFEILPMTA